MKSGEYDAYSNYLETSQVEELGIQEAIASSPAIIGTSASTSSQNPAQQQLRNKRGAPESGNSSQSEAKRRSNQGSN